MTIGIMGRKRCGKNSIADIFIECFRKEGILAKRYAFADELKKELDPLFLLNAGVSAFTEDSVEKELVRKVLIAYGTGYWRNKDPDHWIKKVEAAIKNADFPHVQVISDLRFCENELPWVKNKGMAVYLDRLDDNGESFPCAGIDEEENDPWLRIGADYFLEWKDFHDDSQKIATIGEQHFYTIFGGKLEELRKQFPI